MFDNIGAKCKRVAKALFCIGVIASIAVGIYLTTLESNLPAGVDIPFFLYGVLTMVVGSIFSWIGSIGLYAIGEAAENSAIAANLAIKADKQRDEVK